MHLYIIRHGETRLNKEGRLQGQSDAPLSPEGETQAEKAAAALQRLGISFVRAYASPLGREIGNCDTYEVARGTGTDWEKPRLIYTERSQA